jgi:hypothetical protein
LSKGKKVNKEIMPHARQFAARRNFRYTDKINPRRAAAYLNKALNLTRCW